jgi:hypothetical protein
VSTYRPRICNQCGISYEPTSSRGHVCTTCRPETSTAPREPDKITCGGCDTTWTGLLACRCSGCHHTFSGLKLFDRHRTATGTCLDPHHIFNPRKERVMFHRDGMWRGPVMDEETKLKRFGAA